jgi:hypothetical protein
MKGICEQGVKENIWTKEGERNGKLYKMLHNDRYYWADITRRVIWVEYVARMKEMRNRLQNFSREILK